MKKEKVGLCMECGGETFSDGTTTCDCKPLEQIEPTAKSSVELSVKPACEFTDKQLEIISLAVEKWLLEDTFINYNGKHGAHFIDKKNGNPTLRDRLLEMSK